MLSVMDKVGLPVLRDSYIKGVGIKIIWKGMGYIRLLMGMYMRGIFRIIVLMEKGCILIAMVQSMMESGWKIKKMERGSKYMGLTSTMMESGRMAINTVRGIFNLQMEVIVRVIFFRIIFMEWLNIIGRIKRYIKDSGV